MGSSYARFIIAVVLTLAPITQASAFVLIGISWPTGRLTFNVNFADSNPGLNNTQLFQTAFEAAIQDWNDESAFQFDVDTSVAVDPCTQPQGSVLNGVSFAADSCGIAFGSGVLAVARTFSDGNGNAVRTGVIFDSSENWGVNSGDLIFGQPDFQRTALHELGHTLGLDHQSGIGAIMNPSITNQDQLQNDDLAGAAALYDLDGDGIGFAFDNCSDVANADQSDLDGDLLGDACDTDLDGDGALNPTNSNPDAITLDQAYLFNSAPSSQFAFGGGPTSFSYRFAQTFEVDLAGTLSSISIPVACSAGTLMTVQVVRLNAGGEPSDAPSDLLGEVQFANGINGSGSNFASIVLTSPESRRQVAVGDMLAVTAQSNSRCGWSTRDNFYDRGVAFQGTSSSWFAFSGGVFDLAFASFVIPSELDNCPFVANVGQEDSDGDGVGDACSDSSGDTDDDGILNGVDNCPMLSNADQANFDMDSFGDVCDVDIDNDGSLNALDSNDRNANICSDNDNDQCDDCSSGVFSPGNDGADNEADGLCDIGDPDDDNDNIDDIGDNCPLIANGDQANFDLDPFGDVCDADIDNDGALNAVDSNDRNANICSDSDADLCDDCSSGSFNLNNDGADNDSDGLCNLGDLDDDNDTVPDTIDNCDFTPNLDQANFDRDQEGDLCDADADNDQVLSTDDSNDLNPRICADTDSDQCDDCSSGSFSVANDGLDTDGDGICNVGDADDDNDTVPDVDDNCQFDSNLDQADVNDNEIGDVCDGAFADNELCIPLRTTGRRFALICL